MQQRQQPRSVFFREAVPEFIVVLVMFIILLMLAILFSGVER